MGDKSNRREALAGVAMLGVGGLVGLGASASAQARGNGIQALLAVTQTKVTQANETAIRGAAAQRKAIAQAQASARGSQKGTQALDAEQAERFKEISELLKNIQIDLDKLEKMAGSDC